MKILIVTNMYPCHGDVTWRGGFVKDQVDAFQKLKPETQIDIHHIKAKVSGGTNLSYLKAFLTLSYKYFFEKYDVIHSHHAFCTLLCFFWRRKLVYTVHEGELNNKKARSALIKLAIKISNSVIFVSHDEFKNSKKDTKHFLPCGVNHFDFIPTNNICKTRESLGLPPNGHIILFPADPNRPEKNANILNEVEKKAKSLSKDWIFIYGGTIDKCDMPKYMQASDIVVSIGQYESDGMVIKEAISCNTPVLATNVGNAKHYINESNGTLTDANPESVYQAIITLLSNNESYRHGRKHLLMLGQDMECVSHNLNNIYNTISTLK